MSEMMKMNAADKTRLKALLRGSFEEFAENFWWQHNGKFDWLTGPLDPDYLEVLRDLAAEHYEQTLARSR